MVLMKCCGNSRGSWFGLGTIALVLLCWISTGIFQREILNGNGLPQLWKFLSASVHPVLSWELLKITWDAAIVTLAYAVCGTFLTVVIGAIAGVLCSEVWWYSWQFRAGSRQGHASQYSDVPFTIARLLLSIPRAIHELIWGLFLLNIWGLDPLVAVVAIAIPFGAMTAKVFSEILDDTPRDKLQALLSSGVSPLSACFYSLFPQAFLNLLSYTFYRFECALRSAAVLGIIGAGGLGYQILLSLQSLKYRELWTFFYALLILNGVVDWASASLRHQLGCTSRLDLASQSQLAIRHPTQVPNSSKKRSLPWLLPIALLITIFSFWYINPDYGKLLSPRSQFLFQQFMTALWPPDAQLLFPKNWFAFSSVRWQDSLIAQSWDTIAMAVVGMTIAAIGGLGLAFPAARNFFLPGGLLNQRSGHLWIAWSLVILSRGLLLLSRAIPAPIWALVVLYVMFPGILPGAIALGIHNLGILGRLMAEVIENLDQRPLQALRTTGAKAIPVFFYGVLPLVLPRFLAYSFYRWEICMRETVIVGLVGAGGLGRSLTEQLSSLDYRALGVTLAVFLVLTFAVDWFSGIARRQVR
ncbi:MAG: ABC transporter permease subunit [Synechococcales bacterium]|nr:ABC transporter permease subunit [Synechococcales bacterium]